MGKKDFRIVCAVKALARESDCDLHFLTFTTPDICTVREVAKRWRSLVNSRWWRVHRVRYVMVYEKHPNGHGWHIHAVINRFLRVDELRGVCADCGFGRFRIDRVVGDLSKVCLYLSKYVAKQLGRRDPDSKGVRLVNVSRGLCTLRDIVVDDPCLRWSNYLVRDFVDLSLPMYKKFLACRHLWLTDGLVNSGYLHGLGVEDDAIFTLIKKFHFFVETHLQTEND